MASEPEALREAEAFVRAQGYAGAAPHPDTVIVPEGIEGTVADRRNTLIPTPISAERQETGWFVMFGYADPALAGRGRALVWRDGETPHFMHQDVVLPSADSPEPSVFRSR